MFRKASESIVENCGSKTLHPVTDLSSAERFKPLCIVEKRKSFWPFKKSTMTPTVVKITHLLKDNKETILDQDVNKREFTLLKQFEDLPTFDIKGSLSGKIAKECNLELKAEDKMTLSLKLGDIEKNEISWQKLDQAMKTNNINVNHHVIRSAKHTSRLSLCVVMESIATKEDGTVQEGKTLDVSSDADVDVGKTTIIPKVHPKGSYDKKLERSFTIPPGTVLGYSCVEFSVSNDGSIHLHPVCDMLDHEAAPVILDSEDSVDGLPNVTTAISKIKAEFQPFFMCKKFGEIIEKLKLLLINGRDNEFHALDFILHHSILPGDGLEEKDMVNALNIQLENKISSVLNDFVDCLGFTLSVGASGLENITIPKITENNNGLLLSAMGLVDSINDLQVSSRQHLPKISCEHLKVILHLVESLLEKKDIAEKDSAIQTMMQNDSSALALLTNCGFLKSSESDKIVYTGGSIASLLDTYAVLYVFCNGN